VPEVKNIFVIPIILTAYITGSKACKMHLKYYRLEESQQARSSIPLKLHVKKAVLDDYLIIALK
jgi:hypothetical protein